MHILECAWEIFEILSPKSSNASRSSCFGMVDASLGNEEAGFLTDLEYKVGDWSSKIQGLSKDRVKFVNQTES